MFKLKSITVSLRKMTYLLVALLLFAGFGSARVFADDFTPTASVSNSVPSFTTGPSDGSSSTATPTNVGINVTFTATAADANGDQYYLAICKTNAVAAGTDAAPTCTGGSWAISTATNSTSQASVTYTALVGDAESNAWYAFVCDKKPSGAGCSTSSQGSGVTGSPFNVNHKPSYTFTSALDTGGGTVAPGDTVRVTVTLADSDTDGGQDTVRMHVCASGDTFGGGVCSGTEYCNSALAVPGSAYCDLPTSLTTVPTAHGSYGFEVFTKDEHGMTGTDSSAQTYSVIDVAPYLDATFGSSGYTNADAPSLVADSSDEVIAYVGIKDDNGDLDVTDLEMAFFDSSAITNVCTASENNCYILTYAGAGCTFQNRSTAGSGKTATGTDNAFDATCTYTVWFNANYSTGWKVHAKPTDGLGKVTSLANSTQSVSSNALQAVTVVEASIAYGALAIGTASSGQTTSFGNVGNQIIDLFVSGAPMCTDSPTCAGSTIAQAQQKWTQADGVSFNWDTQGHPLLASASAGNADTNGCANVDMAVRTDHTSTSLNESFYWILKIPAVQATGSYTGSTTIVSGASTSCTGTP